MKSIGSILKDERISKNITIKELSTKIKKSSPYISMIENNKTKPTTDYLYNFSSAIYDDDKKFIHLIAEKYIFLCLKGDIELKEFPGVKEVLKLSGQIENENILKNSYYNLNWLLGQNQTDVTFGVRPSFEFDKLNLLRPLESHLLYQPTPKKFFVLNGRDKKFILNVITDYLETKYENEDILDDDYNTLINDSFVPFDYEKMSDEIKILDIEKDKED